MAASDPRRRRCRRARCIPDDGPETPAPPAPRRSAGGLGAAATMGSAMVLASVCRLVVRSHTYRRHGYRPRTTSRPASSRSIFARESRLTRSSSSVRSRGDDLRHVRDRVLRQTRHPRRQQHVARRVRPPQIAGKRHADHRRQSGFDSGPRPGRRRPDGETRGPSLWAGAIRPSTHRPGRSPFDTIEHAPAGCGEEGIIGITYRFACAVHRFGDLVARMARNVFVERGGVQLAPGSLLPPGQSLRALEDFVGD